MPKFVSGSSGHIYAHGKVVVKKKDDEKDELSSITGETHHNDSVQKPSAINKKGSKEKQKNSLDLFKEELRRLSEERNEQRNKFKKSIKDCSQLPDQTTTGSRPSPILPAKSQSVPVPLKPDPRCPTALTLQINLNPRDRDSAMGGSYDNGDPTTTNIYVGNVNPAVNENDLCDLFGRYGPLASIKIMWPRTDEERARNRNSGFVAYMSRIDAERAIKALNGREIRGYDMKLGWGKAVPIPKNPVFVPQELLKLTMPPPKSGLPFNGQLHESDVENGYVVPNPYPKPLPVQLESELTSKPNLRSIKETYDEFMSVVRRSTVKVIPPTDRLLLDRIHKTIEYVMREGPVFEAIIIVRENKNPAYSFLYDNQSQEHIYYRWKLYSMLHGEDPYEWRTEEFRMFEDGPIWKPPPLNPYADGMPEDLIKGPDALPDKSLTTNQKRITFLEGSLDVASLHDDSRVKGTLGEAKREMLGDILRNLNPTKAKIGASMMFCINHADAAKEIIECIYESLRLLETPFQKKIARLYLISDILHNCSAAVTNASYYREGFQSKLVSVFEYLREYLINIEDLYKADKFKQKVLSVLGAWKEWTLYEDEFVFKLSNILLGIKQEESQQQKQNRLAVEQTDLIEGAQQKIDSEGDLDGLPVDDETLGSCLAAKGLSLRWYKTLELSEDEEVDDECESDGRSQNGCRLPKGPYKEATSSSIRFKTSKWETVDPNEVADQVVTISKWESMAREEEENSSSEGSSPRGSTCGSRSEGRLRPDCDKSARSTPSTSKRFKGESIAVGVDICDSQP